MHVNDVEKLSGEGEGRAATVSCVWCRSLLDRRTHRSIRRRSIGARAPWLFFIVVVVVVLATNVPADAGVPSSSTMAAFGAPFLGAPAQRGPAVVGIVATTDGRGYYVLRSSGEVDAYGAPFYGALRAGSLPVDVTATGIALDAVTGGYWIVTSNGVVRGFNAPYFGEPRIPSGGWGQYPAAVGIAAPLHGNGYYVLRANGAVDHFGVPSYGSLAGRLHYGAIAPIVAVAMAVDSVTGGYWIATSNGGVESFHAPFFGAPVTRPSGVDNTNPVTSIAAASGGRGYYVLRANGDVENFGAPLLGSLSRSGGVPRGAADAIAIDAATGGYYVAIDATPLGGYLNPLRRVSALVPQEIDQGVDYCGSGPVYAIGNGVVTNLYDAQWPSGVFISYRLTSGSAKGLVVYVAENVTPSVTVGEHVTAMTIVGVVHDAKTCLETGWTLASLPHGHVAGHAQFNGRNSTAYGLNFSALLEALGARPGLVQPYGPSGTVPSAWPTW